MRKNTKGITLIALVITIIVLLILSGVSIAMLTEKNGILTQAQNAKSTTENKNAEEKVKLAVAGAIAKSNDGTLTMNNLKEELSNYGITIDKTEFPVEIELDGQKLAINNSGKVTNYKKMADITGQETANTTTKDSFGNYIVVPAGFKVINLTENVTDGIVIEDVSHEATAGSQFVWIPVGNIIKDSNGNTESIKLSRYTFADDNVGTPIDQGSAEIENIYDNSCNFIEMNTSTYGNATAKENIESEETGFRKSAKDNHGYYIGRYEARDKVAIAERTNSSNATNQVVCTDNNYIYNYVTQKQAAELSREMYSDNNFESDLVNSYAWDTAVYFLQIFDNRTDKTKAYSRQSSLNIGSLASQGTNKLEDTSKQDVICNVYDMASNCLEWTTETCNSTDRPCTYRGGVYDGGSGYYTSLRYINYTSSSGSSCSFRTILYM